MTTSRLHSHQRLNLFLFYKTFKFVKNFVLIDFGIQDILQCSSFKMCIHRLKTKDEKVRRSIRNIARTGC